LGFRFRDYVSRVWGTKPVDRHAEVEVKSARLSGTQSQDFWPIWDQLSVTISAKKILPPYGITYGRRFRLIGSGLFEKPLGEDNVHLVGKTTS